MLLVKGRPVYGYNAAYYSFVKILFLSPQYSKRAAALLQSQLIMGHRIKVYEAHIPWELQFLMEHNLYGMGLVRVANPKFRQGGFNELVRISKCDVEMDVQASDILNRLRLSKYRNSRSDASSMFPKNHFMPSVVEMLNLMELDLASQSQDPVKPEASHITSNEKHAHCLGRFEDTHENLELKNFCALLPEACDYELLVDKRQFPPELPEFDWISSPIGGACFSNEPPISVDLLSEIEFSTPTKISFAHPTTLPFIDEYDNEDVFSSSLYSSQVISLPVVSLQPSQKLEFELDLDYLSTQIIQSPSFKKKRTPTARCYKYGEQPPSMTSLISSLNDNGIPVSINQAPFYSVAADKSSRTTLVAGQHADIPLINIDTLPFFDSHRTEAPQVIAGIRLLRPLIYPPKLSDLESFTEPRTSAASAEYNVDLSSENSVCILSLEIFCDCREKLLPDPQFDPVVALFYTVYTRDLGMIHGIIGTISHVDVSEFQFKCVDVIYVTDEEAIFAALLNLINETFDPDVLLGYDIHRCSFNYLQERALYLYSYDLQLKISRKRFTSSNQAIPRSEPDPWSLKKTSAFQVYGRIVLNVWRLMRSELAITDYSFESVFSHVFPSHHLPKYCQWQLKSWFVTNELVRLCEYFLFRTMGNISLLIETQVFTRTSEFARLFGVDFFSIISRGSQFKVESLLSRLGHLENFLFFSPSKLDIVQMKAPEHLQLIMEPEGKFYEDPIVILDFQSLYPSVMIAYNFCFSTLLGKTRDDFPRHSGVVRLDGNINKRLVREDLISAVNDVSYVKKNIREGLLSKMLTELLDARLKIKMKLASTTDLMERKVLDARQLGIKFILNVTYGYTAASFSGRMPCVDLADSIVATGRATLEKAISFIETSSIWRARVVYGDTDSLFVLLPGRSRVDAFRIGREMAQAVTASNPHPVTLRFEKVYHPACLMAKKRYCGMRWNSPVSGEYEGKGVETVRRDGCMLVRRLFRETAECLFSTPNLSLLKDFVQNECMRIINGQHDDMSQFIFSREVRFGTYSGESINSSDSEVDPSNKRAAAALPPSAVVAAERLKRDRRDVAQYGERIPYVVIYVRSDARLIDCLCSPESLLTDTHLELNYVYYINKQLLPALNRLLMLIGVDVFSWWQDVPQRVIRSHKLPAGMDGFVFKKVCVVCGHPASNLYLDFSVCRYCTKHVDTSLETLLTIHDHLASTQLSIVEGGKRLCRSTDHTHQALMCWSLSCPLLWQVVRMNRSENNLKQIQSAIEFFTDQSEFSR